MVSYIAPEKGRSFRLQVVFTVYRGFGVSGLDFGCRGSGFRVPAPFFLSLRLARNPRDMKG